MATNNLLIFCKRNKEYKLKFTELSPAENFDKIAPERILETLCEFLMCPKYTEDVADCFPELLPALVSMAISADNMQSSALLDKDFIHKLNAVILGKLIVINQDLLTFVLRYFDINPAPFEPLDANTAIVISSKRQNTRKLSYISEVSEYDIVTACYNILQSAVSHFKHKWNWSKFYKYLTNTDDRVKWIALKCIAIVLNMSECARLSYARTFLVDPEKFLTDHKDKSADTRIACANIESVGHTVKDIPSVVSVGGILLLTRQSSNRKTSNDLVQVPSTKRNLQSLAIAIGSRKCICLQGPVGCGKTALVEYLARVTGHDASNFVKVQLGDQTDSKMLLGMYKCTDVPGEFVWQPGVLTQAVIAGKWLLLEDIDSAPLDVASVLNNLMETGTLCVPGYRDTIYANSKFQLFVTQRLATVAQKHVTPSSSLLQKHWLCLDVEPSSKEELVDVVKTLFPVLSTAATKIINVFLLFSVGHHDNEDSDGILSSKTGRQTSTRDLIKWCSRAIVNYDVSSSDSALKILQDAIDVFCCSVADQEQRLNLATLVAQKLGIINTKAEYFCKLHKPAVNLQSEVLIIGRARLLRKKAQYVEMEVNKTTFSFTRPSACLLERIASCVALKEPVLLVGETGTGKTSTVQYLAKITGHKLTVINMNQQSESTDLLGGYKPIDFKFLIGPIRQEFDILFRSYFIVSQNEQFLEEMSKNYKQQNWKSLMIQMRHSARAAVKRLRNKFGKAREDETQKDAEKCRPSKRFNVNMWQKWENMLAKLEKFYTQVTSQNALVFSFIESSLVKAIKDGSWVLLDEINLANAETLECLSGLLESSTESLPLLERGDGEVVKRHPDFMMFACMNPATDIGKRDLPVGLRNRFTEFYVDELTDQIALQLLVNSYLKNIQVDKHEAMVKFYLDVRKRATSMLSDGTTHPPHYSLRTLCRALNISVSNPCVNILRSIFEAFSVSFLTQLDHKSYPIVQRMIVKTILGGDQDIKAFLSMPISKPKCGPRQECVNIEGYWVLQGSLTLETPSNYILTDSVRRNLRDLVRVVSIGKLPVLLQGDTSVGKTSLITYLAKISGHICVRINNHEHTDLQEYVGSYVADETGKLVFKEGVLVNAMRQGHWIILDELNLAPSDVLEALNRVLDDNRELFISETQQVVKAHEHFMLFATQNPPGIYGGRKVLSRAFRNRFVELHFDEIPANELQIILHKRCNMPESYCKEVVGVMTDLQMKRKSTAAFAGKKGFITLRDLFRWGERYRLASNIGNGFYDWKKHLAEEGYLVLAAKVRKLEEENEIRQVIEKHLKSKVDPDCLFTLNDKTSLVTKHILEEILNKEIPGFGHIVWTYHMRRMAVLVKKSCQFKEPVLLVGETGGGKTTVCQLIATINGQTMRSVNCHMHTESSDFLGNLRPVREHTEDDKKLFEWVDGPLVNAMRNGDMFLADEISLADDSVLERLNSLLEPERSLLLAEKGIESSSDEENAVIVADKKFVFIGTMNPGGDYGKKELSPALRNRFTEVWCEGCAIKSDLHDIMAHNLRIESHATKESVASAILKFTEWLHTTEVGKKLTVSVRDMLTWVNFINTVSASTLTIGDAYYHGACLTYIDSLGSGSTGTENIKKLKNFTDAATRFIRSEIEHTIKSDLSTESFVATEETVLNKSSNTFGISPFYIEKGENVSCDRTFIFSTPTTNMNALKLLRALQLSKPILLEGSPGVGKTSLVSALAKAAGHTLLRINLSDQTDVSDLFGADLPVEGGKGGEFAWRDGPFLRALRAGYWILLDELNLASQSVLEGLNACFDHRGEVYIPELGKTFSVKPGTRLFGCQNPLQQGGARRGLPRSFLNRFTQISIDALMEDDLKFILGVQFPQLSANLINDMVRFNSTLASEVGIVWGRAGSPWEMNLRDLTRWCETTIEAARNKLRGEKERFNPSDSVELIYVNRMRTKEDRQKVYDVYQTIFSLERYPLPPNQLPMHITANKLFVGDVTLSRRDCSAHEDGNLLLLRDQKMVLKNLMQCIKMNWMSILVGASGCGKSNVVRLLAALVGQQLRSIAVNSAMDTTEILGGFEQTDYNRHLEQLFERVETLLADSLRTRITVDQLEQVTELHGRLEQVRRLFDENVAGRTMAAETKQFQRKIQELSDLVSALETWQPSLESELRDIQSRLLTLSSIVRQDKCLNAGGKFEWVDSVLVKCLQDGTWLLIDQVNLCSPAVLDRLNGLLEPNGVLSIGERGVDDDGNVVTIKPHENFRLFLTMDPRYGEISRAMRNRGVEICILGPREKVDHDAIDLKSLLFNAGITRPARRDALLAIYGRMSQELLAVDRLSAVDLLHTAFLARQRSLRGFPADRSIRDACVDVYVKARPTRDLQHRQHVVSLIDEAIERLLSTRDEEISPIDVDAATWSVRNLQDNSALTVVRQQGLLLNAAVRICGSRLRPGAASAEGNDVTTRSLNVFCGLEEDEGPSNVAVKDVLSHLLLNFYEQSSPDDVSLRKEWVSKTLREWVSKKVRKNRTFDALKKGNELMAREIASFSFRSANTSDSLPWDQWWLSGETAEDDAEGDASKLTLLLYVSSTILREDELQSDAEKNSDVMSIRQYSDLLRQGKLLPQTKDYPLITHFVEILQRTSSCIDAILRDDNVSVSSEEYVKLRRDLRWYTRFEGLGETTLVNKKKSKNVFVSLKQTSALLRVHYKWLLKFLRKLFEMARESTQCQKTMSRIKLLTEITDDLNDQLKSVYDPVRKISKIVKRYLTLPPPHPSEVSVNVHSELNGVTRDLEAQDEAAGILKRELKIASVQLNDAPAMRRQTISLWSDVYSGKVIDEGTLETALAVKRFCDDSHIRLRTSAEIESVRDQVKSLSAEEMTRLIAGTQLWPVYEYVFLSFASSLQKNLCLKETIRAAATTTEECLARYADVVGIPSDLMGLLSAITRPEVERRQRTLLLPRLFYQLAQFTRRSYAVRDSSLLLQWRGITEEEDAEDSLHAYVEPKTECYFGGPVLLNLILRLTFDKADGEKKESALSAVALGTYAAQMNQLQLLNEILWRNSISLTRNSACDDLVTLKYYLSLCLSAIDQMSKEHNVLVVIANVLEKLGGKRETDVRREVEVDYLIPVGELRQVYDKIEPLNERHADQDKITICRGRGWMLLGYVQLLLFGNLDSIDPVHKVELKLKYLDEDIVDCERTMHTATLQSRVLGVNAHAHPRLAATRNCSELLLGTRGELSRLKAYRPPSVDFTVLGKICAEFRSNVGAYRTVEKHVNKLCTFANEIGEKLPEPSVIARAEIASQEAQVWSKSVQHFAEQLEIKYLSAYPDVILPLLTGLAQLRHGVCILVNEIQRLVAQRTNGLLRDFDSEIYNLIRFPTIGPYQESLLKLSALCASRRTRLLIDRNFGLDAFVNMREQFRILKSSLHELHNHAILSRGLTTSLWQDMNSLLLQIVLVWKQQQQEEEKRAAEKDSLYKNKTASRELTEEQELALEIRQLFPTHRDSDFHDVENESEPSLERRDPSPESPEKSKSLSGLIGRGDIREIQRIHSDMVTSLIAAKWKCDDVASASPTNYVEPLMQRYDTVHSMLDNVLPALSERVAIELHNSLNLLVALRLRANRASGAEHATSYDFYKDCNVEEVKQCLPVCESILNRVDQLLQEWPAHPTLRSIRSIIERVYTFPVTSAVSRFLTGLELLLVKMHQWEENAHSGVSMADDIATLTRQIISWRKLELSGWKGCLDATFRDLKSRASKWWFFLYALVESYVNEDGVEGTGGEPVTRQKLLESLERFMNESPLVEFEPRLELLLTFHCHVYYSTDSDRKNELTAVLWNVHRYYEQFVGDVQARIAALKAPIEKKLRDFVKIARWNDINYWAVKEAVEKTHRTLHKFVKEFQSVLEQNASSCLIVKSGSYSTELDKGIWHDRDHRKYLIDPKDFAVAKPSQFVEASALSTSKLVARAETLRAKAAKLCEEIVLMSSYPCARGKVENFVEGFLEQSARLRDMDVDRTAPKSKQKSQAKSILQQKRTTLANCFKALTQMGVSYRTGVLTWKNNEDKVMDFTVSPLDLSVIERYLRLRNVDRHLLTQWRGCDKYYYKSLIRLNALNAMLHASQTDLGPQNMERCRGYSAHLMLMAHKQKTTIAQTFDRFSSLRVSLSSLSETSEKDLSATMQRAGWERAANLKELLVTLEAGFEQLLLFLQCCPQSTTTDARRAALTLDANALPIIGASQDDDVWKTTDVLLRDCLDSIKTTATRFRALFVPLEVWSADNSAFLSSRHLEFLEEQCSSTIEHLMARCDHLRQLFENPDGVAHPIIENIAFLDKQIRRFVLCMHRELDYQRESAEFESQERRPDEAYDAVQRYETALEELINTTLLVIQKKYKDQINLNDVAPVNKEPRRENEETDDEGDEEEIEEGQLKEILVEALGKDIVELKLPQISGLFSGLLSSIRKLSRYDVRSANHCSRLLRKCSPLLEQYILLVQFYLNEQVASFRVTCKMLYLQLNVFLDLAANGFCVPKDLDLEEGETDESGQKTDKGGMGLAEGEGTKDVSDRIESEDQLEDAKPADQEQEKQEDKTCKEEEKGIDMSEDFDSKLQDMEKGDDDEEQSGDEGNDLDKEMGETGEGAEQLDKEIWADDKEESPEEDNQPKDEGEEGIGEQIGEKEMSAKDDKDQRQRDNDDDMDVDENRQEEEREEINELNEPEIDEDQIDPYHGKHQPEPEPEPFDLPDDLNLDEDGKEENGAEEENPFDIDAMKDSKPPPEKMDVDEEPEMNEKNDDPNEDSSEDEDGNDQNVDKENREQDLEADEEETEQNIKEGAEAAKQDDKEEHQEEDAKEENLCEKAAPSADDASKQADAAQQVEETKEGSRDAVAQASNSEDQQEASAENTQEEKDDKGTGQSQSAQQDSGHSGSSKQQAAPVSQRDAAAKPLEKRKNPGESNEDRSLMDKLEPTPKKLKTVYTSDQVSNNEEQVEELGDTDGNKAEMCQHVKESEAFDDYTLDAATEDQVKQQASNAKDEENNEEKEDNDAMDVEMHQEDEETTVDDNEVTEQRSDKVSQATEDKRKDSNRGANNTDNNQTDAKIELEGEAVQTMTVQRGETTFHTMQTNLEDNELSSEPRIERKRLEVETMLGEWTQKPTTEEAAAAWNCLSSVTDIAARDLSEKLRLVLEPTQASRLKGDYKTGKRINMRKIIPYIASQFRKDKIWLRRTKPSKRDYQVVLALDDSKSMTSNHAQEMAFESLALICKAMTYLEVGQLGVVSFGAHMNVLHPLGEVFTEQSGSRLIQEMRFDQKSTNFAEVVDFTVNMFESQRTSSSDNAKLLVILSDGMGMFTCGTQHITRAVRRARLANIFIVFIILDNPTNKYSIVDMRTPIFQGNKIVDIQWCMNEFPFPFYMIVRDINTLPGVLSDALRQWFEVVGKTDT